MSAGSKPPTKAEVTALLVGWKALEQRRAAARIKAERSAHKRLTHVVQLHTAAAADRLSNLPSANRISKGLALAAIHSSATGLREDAASAIAAGRSDARDASRIQVVKELDHLSSMLRRDGWTAQEELPSAPEAGDSSADPIAASAAASSLSARWQTAALGAVLTWESEGGSLPIALRRNVTALRPAVDRIAAVETGTAFQEEQDDALEPLSDFPWSAQVFKVWSAVLDGRLCQRCYEMDGEAIPVNGVDWKHGATLPMHPFCRCMEVPLYIPKPRALTDVALDYAGYKAEVRDQVRESRGRSPVAGRHAAQFIGRSRAGRSPIVISHDFAVGRLARRTGT